MGEWIAKSEFSRIEIEKQLADSDTRSMERLKLLYSSFLVMSLKYARSLPKIDRYLVYNITSISFLDTRSLVYIRTRRQDQNVISQT